jgi:hypothetical protein
MTTIDRAVLGGPPDGNFDLILILERPDDDCSRTSTSTKTVAAWNSD